MRGRQGKTANEIKRDSGEWKEEGGDKRMAIFSFGCLNWHEEPNQISPGRVGHMVQRRRRVPACIFMFKKDGLRFRWDLLYSPLAGVLM